MELRNVAAIVTGGASGLGGATAQILAQGGAKVTLFDLNARLGVELAKTIGGLFAAVDVTDVQSVVDGLDEAERTHGTAQILVNCAGIGPPGKTVGRDGRPLPLSTFRKIVEVNLVGTFNVLSQFAARLMQMEVTGEERGVIVNTASAAAFDGQVGQPAYAASKSAIVGMTLPIARELASARIRVVTIAPGLFLTPLLASLPEEAQQSLAKQVPFPSRLGDPLEYGMMVESIVRNPMLNGETIRLDGAVRMGPR